MAENRQLVEHVIESDPVIKKGLQRGIINSRALARYIQDNGRVDATFDAILGIIRRHPLAQELTSRSQFLANSGLGMRSRVAILSLEQKPETMKRIVEFKKNNPVRGGKLRVVEGMHSICVIGDQKSMEQLRTSFPSEDIIQCLNDLVEISISLMAAATLTKGVYAKIMAELALNDVNLVALSDSYLEIDLLVEEKNATRAIETLHNMILEDSSKRLVPS